MFDDVLMKLFQLFHLVFIMRNLAIEKESGSFFSVFCFYLFFYFKDHFTCREISIRSRVKFNRTVVNNFLLHLYSTIKLIW